MCLTYIIPIFIALLTADYLRVDAVIDNDVISNILAELNILKSESALLQQQMTTNQKQFEERLHRQDEIIASLLKKVNSNRYYRQLQGGSGVAFTAFLSAHASNLGHETIIPFDSVITNEGNAFNTVTHMFTCPITGIYAFQTALLSQINGFAITEIVKQGIRLVQAHTEGGMPGTTASGYDQGFNSVVTLCQKGEQVWVRNFQHYSDAIYGDRYTTFTGYILWETEAGPVVVG